MFNWYSYRLFLTDDAPEEAALCFIGIVMGCFGLLDLMTGLKQLYYVLLIYL